jgi:predicted nucleic acid-binding protein
VLAAVEVPRAASRSGGDASTAVADVLEVVNLIALDMRVVEAAAVLVPSALRTLDAIHLASAVSLGADVAGFVTYDERLAKAATSAGLQVLAPI